MTSKTREALATRCATVLLREAARRFKVPVTALRSRGSRGGRRVSQARAAYAYVGYCKMQLSGAAMADAIGKHRTAIYHGAARGAKLAVSAAGRGAIRAIERAARAAA